MPHLLRQGGEEGVEDGGLISLQLWTYFHSACRRCITYTHFLDFICMDAAFSNGCLLSGQPFRLLFGRFFYFIFFFTTAYTVII
jgi:hypothetical protein